MHEHTVEIRNHLPTVREVAIEPWADSFFLKPGETLTVIGTGSRKGKLTVYQDKEVWVVSAWNETKAVRVIHNGETTHLP